MSAPRVGDFVKVVSGPAFAGPRAKVIKGRVEEVTPTGNGDAEVMVRVPSGGLWGFRATDLRTVRQ